MAGAGVEVKYDETKYQEIIDLLSKASSAQMEDLAWFAGEELHYLIWKKAFLQEKDPATGEKWKPLKHPRRPSGDTKPILQYGGQLRRSLMYETYPDGSVTYGTNMEYARIHQEGGQAGRGKKTTIPARPYLGYPDDFIYRNILDDPQILRLLRGEIGGPYSAK